MTARTSTAAVLFHGYRATPHDHWFPWLARCWGEQGVPVEVPALPRSDAPDPGRWRHEVDRHLAALEARGGGLEDAVVVAHSLGAATAIRALAERPGEWSLGALVLVAPFSAPLPALPDLDRHVDVPVDLAPVAERARELVVLRSDADSVVPPRWTDEVAGALGVRATIVEGAGHFLAEEGVLSIDRLATPPGRGRREACGRRPTHPAVPA